MTRALDSHDEAHPVGMNELLAPEPVTLYKTEVARDWVDFNGHMNAAYYAILFDRALDNFLDAINLGRAYSEHQGGSMFVVESHFTYQKEVLGGDPLAVRLQLLDRDRKRLHCFMELYQTQDDFLAATSEQIAVHVDIKARKSISMPVATIDQLSRILDAHGRIARPKEVGHKIGIRRKPPVDAPAF